jgi:hypothetical protein
VVSFCDTIHVTGARFASHRLADAEGLHEIKDFRLTRPSLIMALIMSVMGVFLFVSIITKTL